MKQKLFDKFAELFGNSDGVNFYFSTELPVKERTARFIFTL